MSVCTGDGPPCDQEDPLIPAQDTPTKPLRAVEPFIAETNRTFHRAAVAARVPHVYNEHCGIHDWRNWERELKAWWPRMMRVFRQGSTRHQATRRLRIAVRPRRTRVGRRTAFRFAASYSHAGNRCVVSGALIRFAGRRAKTNARGDATIRVRFRRAGRRRVVVSRRGFFAVPAHVRVLPRRPRGH